LILAAEPLIAIWLVSTVTRVRNLAFFSHTITTKGGLGGFSNKSSLAARMQPFSLNLISTSDGTGLSGNSFVMIMARCGPAMIMLPSPMAVAPEGLAAGITGWEAEALAARLRVIVSCAMQEASPEPVSHSWTATEPHIEQGVPSGSGVRHGVAAKYCPTNWKNICLPGSPQANSGVSRASVMVRRAREDR